MSKAKVAPYILVFLIGLIVGCAFTVFSMDSSTAAVGLGRASTILDELSDVLDKAARDVK